MSTQATPLSAHASKRGEEHVVGKLVMHTVRLEQPITVQFVVYAAIADNTDVLPPHDMVTVVASRRLFTKFSQLRARSHLFAFRGCDWKSWRVQAKCVGSGINGAVAAAVRAAI